MRRLILILTLLFAGAARAQTWASAGLQTNPIANTILADAISVGDSARHWMVVCSASVISIVVLEHRDATNVTTIHSQGFFIPANGTVTIESGGLTQVLFDAERLRVRLNAVIAGSIWCSVFLD